jgi:electron transfer flavoprotein alpha subunit
MNHLRVFGRFSTLVIADHQGGKLAKSTLKVLNGAKLLNQ